MGNGVMKSPYIADTSESNASVSKTMANYINPSSELHADSRMEKMKKMLSSPSTHRKGAAAAAAAASGPTTTTTTPSSNQAPPSNAGSHQAGYFGVHLEDIVSREARPVPYLVTKVCRYIEKEGLDCEGIFRVSGNSRTLDKLRASFDKTADADLDEANDVMAVAGLLKMFLRELPEAVIPDHLTKQFVSVQAGFAKQLSACVQRWQELLAKLPRVHHEVLKYIVGFLVLVARSEPLNKMSPMALGIVFGPNIFRCGEGIPGLKEQGLTNHITLKFITEYDQLFLLDGETSPYSPNYTLARDECGGRRGKNPPPRPPPLSILKQEVIASCPPVPSPRKNKKRVEPASSLEVDGDNSARTTPRISDDEYLDTYRSESPFVLDTDRSDYGATLASPRTVLNPDALVKAISSSVTEHLFGDAGDSQSSDESQTSGKKALGPIPAPRKKKKSDPTEESVESSAAEDRSASDEAMKLTFKEKLQRFESGEEDEESKPLTTQLKRQRPTSSEFNIYEEQGIIIRPAPDSLARMFRGAREEGVEVLVQSFDDDVDTEQDGFPRMQQDHSHQGQVGMRPVAPPRNPKKHAQLKGDSERSHSSDQEPADYASDETSFTNMHQTQATLASFKRAPGPKNRRNPSRGSLKRNLSDDASAESMPQQTQQQQQHRSGSSLHNISEDRDEVSPRPPKPRVFLPEPSEEEQEEEEDKEEEEDVNHNATKPSINFLNIHHNGLTDDQPSPDRSPSVPRKPYIPPLDLSILHEHGDGNEPIPAAHGPSVSLHKAHSFKTQQTEDRVMLSPRTLKLKKRQTNAHPDTDVPPSPPTEQTRFNSKRPEDDSGSQVKQLTKKIQSCKKRIKAFEESFESEHGYRPSQTDKAARPEVKKLMLELAKARKELKKLKEEIENERYAETSPSMDQQINTDGSVENLQSTPGGSTATMKDTLYTLMHKLGDKRKEMGRPEDLMRMTGDQVMEEKLSVQKSLLHFEALHGRPTSKSEKELMRPLYDRYRNIKRLLSKPPSPRDKAQELQPVPEDQTIEFVQTPSTSKITDREPVRVPTADMDEEVEDFLITKDLHLLKGVDTMRPALHQQHQPHPNGQPDDHLDLSPDRDPNRNLHELSIPQLYDEQQRSRMDKKKLRKVLREFEDDFFRQTGRKVQKEDRAPMDTEYQEYKQVKAKLKLLDALLSKHEPMASW